MSDVRQLKNKRPPLFAAVKNDILQKARNSQYPGGKLPSEEELCKIYSVSRATVREALGILHREGFISKRHGTGNFLNYSAINTAMRFDLEVVLPQILENAGYAVSSIREKPKKVSDESGLKNFFEKNNTVLPLLEQVTRHSVKNRTAILTYNYFPCTENCVQAEYGSFEETVKSLTGKQLSHTIQAFIPQKLSAELRREFGTEKELCIMWHQRHYCVDDCQLCESYVFFNPEIVLLHSLTRWL